LSFYFGFSRIGSPGRAAAQAQPVCRSRVLMRKHKAIVELAQVSNTCFVAMPFLPLFKTQYERVIRPAIEEAGLACVRGDEIFTRQMIIEDVWTSIRQARVIVGDISGANPNVLYEIGLAHALGKPIVLINRSRDDVPFDLHSVRYHYYDIS